MALLWHNGAEVLECCCGKIINGHHQCTQDMTSIKLVVTTCGYNTTYRHSKNNVIEEINLACVVCRKDTERKEFASQWAVDRDGYDVCSDCYGKCPYGDLPKKLYGACDCVSDSD
jgi:hypothetical protein